jgi:hypothetical protein
MGKMNKMNNKSHFLSSFKFIMRMLTYPILGQVYIFKIVQHVEVWTHVNFLIS